MCVGSEAENKLLDALFMDEGLYNPAIRPVKNVSDVIKVNVKFTLVQILHVVSCAYLAHNHTKVTKKIKTTKKHIAVFYQHVPFYFNCDFRMKKAN